MAETNRRVITIHRPRKKEDKMNILVQTLIRQGMIVVGTWLVTKGVIQDGQVEALAGIGIAVVAFIWRYVEIRLSKKKLDAAIVAPAQPLPK